MSDVANERLEKLKAERQRLLINGAGTFHAAMELACQSINFAAELLTRRQAEQEGDEEV